MKTVTFDVEGLHHIMVDQLEVLMADPVFHISLPACEEVVHHSHLMAIHHEFVSQMGAHEARASSDLYWDTPEHTVTAWRQCFGTQLPCRVLPALGL